MNIDAGKVVTLAYKLTNDRGDMLDQADPTDPFAYIQGTGAIVEGLEKGLQGMKIGEKKKITVTPSEGYGELNPELKMKVEKTFFPKDVELELGMEFTAGVGSQGETMIFRVDEIMDAHVMVDGNHPLAGETLHFDIEVIGVREATQEEMSHGHAHGPDGHHHH